MMNLGETLARWRVATEPETLFGTLEPPTLGGLRRRYRALAAATHPDRHPHEQAVAHEAFRLLQHWYAVAQRKVARGGYGVAPTLALWSGTRTYVGEGPSLAGDLCELYPARCGTAAVLLKIARHPRANERLEAEARALAHLDRALAGDPLRAHVPTLVESFLLRDEAGAQRRCNALQREADAVTLEAIVAAYPAGIAAADIVWMWNRMLAALAVTHRHGLVHGAVLPPHVLLRLDDHNGILVDWCYSVPAGERLRALCPAYRPWYPPEVRAKQPATPATDLYLSAACVLRLLGGDPATREIPATVPRPLAALLRACLLPSPARRMNDAWDLFDALADVAERLFGPPTFRPFALP